MIRPQGSDNVCGKLIVHEKRATNPEGRALFNEPWLTAHSSGVLFLLSSDSETLLVRLNKNRTTQNDLVKYYRGVCARRTEFTLSGHSFDFVLRGWPIGVQSDLIPGGSLNRNKSFWGFLGCWMFEVTRLQTLLKDVNQNEQKDTFIYKYIDNSLCVQMFTLWCSSFTHF